MHYARHLDGSGQAGPQFSHNRLPYHHRSNFLHTHVLDAPEQCATARVGGSGGGVGGGVSHKPHSLTWSFSGNEHHSSALI